MRKFLFLLAVTVLLVPHDAMAAEIWLSGLDPVVAHDRDANTPDSDYMSLFRPNAPWAKAAGHVQVFKLSTQFLHRATDAQLLAVIESLRARRIALAFEAEILAASVQCGNGLPGFTTPSVIQKAVDHVARLGGRIDYVAFDEPVTWGHFMHHGSTHAAMASRISCATWRPISKPSRKHFPTSSSATSSP